MVFPIVVDDQVSGIMIGDKHEYIENTPKMMLAYNTRKFLLHKVTKRWVDKPEVENIGGGSWYKFMEQLNMSEEIRWWQNEQISWDHNDKTDKYPGKQ